MTAARVAAATGAWLLALGLASLAVGLLRGSAPPEVVAGPLWFGLALAPLLLASGAVLAFTRWVDRQPLASLGLAPAGLLWRWARGALVATLMMGAIALGWFTLADGASLVATADPGRALLALLVAFAVFLVQGPTEELLFRGYILQNVAARWGLPWAVGVSALLFGALHAGNPHFGPLPFVNLVLFGAATALYKVLLDGGRLWGVFAIHSLWNWLQEFVFGLENSGLAASPADTLLRVQPDTARPDWVWGGGFGPEGTLAASLALLALIAGVLMVARGRARAAAGQPAFLRGMADSS